MDEFDKGFLLTISACEGDLLRTQLSYLEKLMTEVAQHGWPATHTLHALGLQGMEKDFTWDEP